MLDATAVKRNDSGTTASARNNWDRLEAEALYALPFAA
jgi:hypothetical protein